jgi:hypothetical protein
MDPSMLFSSFRGRLTSTKIRSPAEAIIPSTASILTMACRRAEMEERLLQTGLILLGL